MPALLGALLQRTLLAQLAVAIALGVLVTAAAWVEGHPPDPWRLRAVALGGGAALGAVWTWSAFRRERGDIALASLGISPTCALFLCLAASLPTLALAGGAPTTERGLIEAGHLRLPAGEVVWHDDVAHRTDLVGPIATFPGLPIPEAAPRRPDFTFLARCLALLAALTWLARRPAPPDVPATVGAGALATVLGLLPAWIS